MFNLIMAKILIEIKRMIALILPIFIIILFPLNSFAEDIDIKITSFNHNMSFPEKSTKMPDGKFQFKPAENAKPSGYIEIFFTVNVETKSIKSKVKRIFKVGGDYFYYFVACDNGNAFQTESQPVPSVNPYVASINDHNMLDSNVAMQMYKTDDLKQQESAIWLLWKLQYGEMVADLVNKLVKGNESDKISSAVTISTFRLYHPLINQAVQKRLAEMQYKPGIIDGILGSRTIAAIKQFQKDHDIDITGWLDEATLIKLFNK